jgi:uncharacterized DUF497 family protein
MIDLGQIVGFDWDDGNNRKSADRHEVSQREAEQIFLDPRLLIMRDEKHSDNEARYHAYGSTAAGRKLQVSFTLRGNTTLIRVISARSMSRKERARYEQEKA